MSSNEQIYLAQLKEMKCLEEIQKNMHMSISNNIKLTKNLVNNEFEICKLNKKIRKNWRQKVGDLTSSMYKSTLWNTNVKDLQNFVYHYSYETLLGDENPFSELLGYSIDSMLDKTFLFSSGMSAISNLFYCFSSFLSNNLNIQASVGYFETKYFFKILSSMGNDVSLGFNCNKDSNTFYFEPIKYDATLSMTNMESLVKSINSSKSKIKFIIMDSTMHNKTNIIKGLIKSIDNIDNVVFCDVRSGLKLDQEGLELSNLGICTIFVSKGNIEFFEAIKRYIEQYKNLTGTNLSFHSLALNHYFEHENKSVEYTKKVKKQIVWAQKVLNERPVSTSSIKNIIWRKGKVYDDTLVAPFIFIELKTTSEKLYLTNIRKLQNKMIALGTPIDYRNSWGFRMPSVEYFNDIFSGKKYIKFYPGIFRGLTAVNAVNSLLSL
ncbi:hypothetical protein [uncultured Lactobacillus sp.]|uniref:hypothetical protein n=1 Tax=uncultured Lactobacillus sp. TaxID=153152 RepID=UPI00259BA160|nr:hypothetical protein [uncultured Lactobacillus sp.]